VREWESGIRFHRLAGGTPTPQAECIGELPLEAKKLRAIAAAWRWRNQRQLPQETQKGTKKTNDESDISPCRLGMQRGATADYANVANRKGGRVAEPRMKPSAAEPQPREENHEKHESDECRRDACTTNSATQAGAHACTTNFRRAGSRLNRCRVPASRRCRQPHAVR